MNLFERAKQVGIQHIRDWLPSGRQDGNEWVALNPTRDDKTAGSFKVNLGTGQWMDNATDDRGGDAVSLYAYLFNGECSHAAQMKGYQNMQGGIQCEAARAILEKHDASYFPDDNDDFMPAKKSTAKGDYWSGWYPVKNKMAEYPEVDTSFFIDKWGKLSERWDFWLKDRLVFCVIRFLDGKTKSDRPFTLWQKGGEYKWRAKAPKDEKYPLWNVNELEERVNDPVILCEGQKAASRGKACAGLSDYVFTGWYGGANNTKLSDWGPLRGRKVYFWPDADSPGRKAIKDLRELATEYDIQLEVLRIPTGVPKGWDLADAIEEGKDILDIINPKDEKPNESGHFLDDLVLPFEIIGTSGDDIVFYPHGSNRICRYKSSSLTKNALMTLADRSVWAEYYNVEGRIAWDAAINDILRRSEKAPVFDFTRVRGAGAWLEDKEVVINTGEYLIVEAEKKDLHERVGRFVYEKQARVPYRAKEPLATEESAKLLEVLTMIDWKGVAAPYALAGWLALAPWGGVLRWRPHVWIVGPRGTGKSWILERIVYPVSIRDFGVKGGGTSTPAGVRQALANSSRCFMGDEMESHNQKAAEQIEQILTLFRGSSSGQESGGSTLHGSQDGEGKLWVMQSMACFASIGAAMRHGADMDRFTVCELTPPTKGKIEDRKARFLKLEEKARVFTDEYSKAFHARMYLHMPELLKAVTIMSEQASRIIGTMRDGDQIGTLMAGCWMVSHDNAPTAGEAAEFLSGIGIASLKADAEEKTDEELCLDEIMSQRMEILTKSGRIKTTIGGALELWYGQESGLKQYYSRQDEYPGLSQDIIRRELEQLGVRPAYETGEELVYIALSHPQLRKSLRESGWANSYASLLNRLPNCRGTKGPTTFSGVKKRYLEIVLQNDEIPF